MWQSHHRPQSPSRCHPIRGRQRGCEGLGRSLDLSCIVRLVDVGGDSRLLYIHCLLYGTPVMGYVLRTIPSSAQCELGLPGSPAVGAPGQGRAKRAKVAEVAIQGMEALTTALTTALGPTVGSAATDIHDNAQALGAFMEQVRAARRDVADNPDDPTSGIVLKHLLT